MVAHSVVALCDAVSLASVRCIRACEAGAAEASALKNEDRVQDRE